MQQTTKKLALNQETLRYLTAEELRGVVGGFCPSNCGCPTTTQPLSCIECNPPDTTGV